MILINNNSNNAISDNYENLAYIVKSIKNVNKLNKMKIIALFLFTFIYVRSVDGFTKDRYEQLGVKLFELIQTQFYSSHLNIANQDEDITITLENIKLITPILSKITYDYDENKPDSSIPFILVTIIRKNKDKNNNADPNITVKTYK